MSISAMNWPNAITPKIRYLTEFGMAAGLAGGTRPAVSAAALIAKALLSVSSLYIICII